MGGEVQIQHFEELRVTVFAVGLFGQSSHGQAQALKVDQLFIEEWGTVDEHPGEPLPGVRGQ
ncbi:hypothetical protein [Streptomyces sp. DASNCL29]|uniref:hypothetical protein n=1 Tax=Streptomyces sp. DASNCL29 TaxID=2583819 RepID=UPI001486CF05|nr:hypothetical protein [Streptomyces sp. DASNCL29]